MAPSHVENLESRLNRSLSSGPVLGRPNQLWWPGPQEWGKTRELVAGPDAYHVCDADGRSRSCSDSRFRSLAARDLSSVQKFGANARDIEEGRGTEYSAWHSQVQKSYPSWAAMPSRVDGANPERNWKLDAYGAWGRRSDLVKDRSRAQSFNLLKDTSRRFNYPKQFGKDYSRVGSGLNTFDLCFSHREREREKRWRR
mmetsp:Transcript_75590/g.130860  ORF Transcript_75590/g.130860 Transcript_75590/m.130860 type:complete len:198 (-) Transcript_75590:109-702(-)